MIEIKTKKNTAKVFTDELDKMTKQQIAATARDPAYADAKIRVMPDTHAGRGCVIGMTMTLNGRVSRLLSVWTSDAAWRSSNLWKPK